MWYDEIDRESYYDQMIEDQEQGTYWCTQVRKVAPDSTAEDEYAKCLEASEEDRQPYFEDIDYRISFGTYWCDAVSEIVPEGR